MPRLPRKPGPAGLWGRQGAVAATLARRREARAPRVVTRDRDGGLRVHEVDEDPVARALLKASEELISAAQRGSVG